MVTSHAEESARPTREECEAILLLHSLLPEAERVVRRLDDDSGREPRYFKYIDGEQEFHPAFDVTGVDTLGDYECGAMEKPMAEFIAAAFENVPKLARSYIALLNSYEQTIQRIAELEAELAEVRRHYAESIEARTK